MSKRLYVAYGSNLNLRQMKMRCPTAKLYGTGTVNNYELQFKGHPNSAFATIAPKEGAAVPVAVFAISPADEKSLDRYEGYPSHYFKRDVPVQLDGEEVNAMVYIMNLKMGFGMPSPFYYQTVYEGYNDCELDTDVLDEALKNSAQKYYSRYGQHSYQQTLFGLADIGDDLESDSEEYDINEYEDTENDEPEIDEPDESDPFYFSDGLHL